MKNLSWIFLLVLLIQGCATTSHFTSIQDGVEVTVGKTNISGKTPIDGKISRTTFGRYPIKIVKDGYTPIYGYLPLKVSPGFIVLDALLFAPAAFFDVQGSAPYYEFDMDTGTIKYRLADNGKWLTYPISSKQKKAAMAFFGDK